jgi:hydroxymethylpyrimidine pyrophosphatase-like HAD family hydrolase
VESSVFCFDLDGALLNREGRIHPSDLVILASRPKSWFVPISGRGLDSVRRIFRRNELFVDQIIPFPMVLLNGAAVYLPGEELCSYTPFSQLVQRTLISLAEDFPRASYLFMDDKDVYMRATSGAIRPWLELYDMRPEDLTESAQHEPFCKVMVVSEDSKELMSIADYLESRHLEISFNLKNVLEMSPPGVTRAAGLKALAKMLEWNTDHIIVAGNDDDDLEIFDLARYSFTTISSPAKIIKKADFVVDLQKAGLLKAMQEVADSTN